MSLLTLIALLASVGATDIDGLVDTLSATGCRRIAIYPELLQQTKAGELKHPFAAQQSVEEMDRVRSRIEASSNESLEILETRALEHAFDSVDFHANDVTDQDKVDAVLKQTGCDALVYGVGESTRSATAKIRLNYMISSARISPSRTNADSEHPGNAPSDEALPTDQLTATLQVSHTLSDLAFSGLSFEARRWVDGQMTYPGFRNDLMLEARKMLAGIGEGHESFQAGFLRDDLTHPLASPDFPFQILIKVTGAQGIETTRPLQAIGGEFYLPVSDGEQIATYFQNRTSKDVLLGLYIDGENSRGKVYQHPRQTRTEGHWWLKANTVTRVRGWAIADAVQDEPGKLKSNLSSFVVRRESTPRGDRMAGDPHGSIVAIFYTNGTEGIDVPPPVVTMGVDIEAGDPEPAILRTRPGSKGLMLAAVTIFYRTHEELDDLRQGRREEQFALEFPAVKTPAGGSN